MERELTTKLFLRPLIGLGFFVQPRAKTAGYVRKKADRFFACGL